MKWRGRQKRSQLMHKLFQCNCNAHIKVPKDLEICKYGKTRLLERVDGAKVHIDSQPEDAIDNRALTKDIISPSTDHRRNPLRR